MALTDGLEKSYEQKEGVLGGAELKDLKGASVYVIGDRTLQGDLRDLVEFFKISLKPYGKDKEISLRLGLTSEGIRELSLAFPGITVYSQSIWIRSLTSRDVLVIREGHLDSITSLGELFGL